MASIDKGYLMAIDEENQRLIDTAKGIWSLETELRDPVAAARLKGQVNRLLDISERISQALAHTR